MDKRQNEREERSAADGGEGVRSTLSIIDYELSPLEAPDVKQTV